LIEPSSRHAVVLVGRGCFARHADGVTAVLDPTVAYCINPSAEQRYDHPHDHGDDCADVFLDAELVAGLCGGDPMLPSGLLSVSPQPTSSTACFSPWPAAASTQKISVDPRRVASGRPATETGSATDSGPLFDGYRAALAVVTLVAFLGLLVAVVGAIRRRAAELAPATAGQ
jgi:hypothetical protein